MKLDLENCMGRRVCVAFSGGGDSLALFHALFSAGVSLSAVNVEPVKQLKSDFEANASGTPGWMSVCIISLRR